MSHRSAAWVGLLVWVALTARAAGGDDGGAFPEPPNSERAPSHALPALEAAAGFGVPAGFRVTVFASEPDVRNPIALAWDARGRLWVAENYTYAENPQKFDLGLRDRVLIFEDADGDGRFDRRTVFTDDVQRLTSVELGLGGVWLMCPPRLLFVPDRDANDVPDGPAEVILDGFTVPAENYHTLANGLKWGPDGWLYGRCGASSPGEIGPPGTPDALRVPVRGGLWRYHPGRARFEVVAHGTTNPWGHDWNALGEAFFINTVNGHLWHVLPGAHFARPHTIDPNPRAYIQIEQHADHLHFDTSKEFTYPAVPRGIDADLGGGHAHSGLMIYLADQWPASYRDKLVTLNFHGRRANVERLERARGGYVGRHEPDILQAADPWFRGIDLSYGPDGGVFILDWSDTGECHEHDGIHRGSGRIYKVTYGEAAPPKIGDVGRLDERALVALHGEPNAWFVRQARRVLTDRAAQGAALTEAKTALRGLYETSAKPEMKLRALWTLWVIGAADAGFLRAQLHHDQESVRAWAVRLLTDAMPIDSVYSRRIGPDVALPDDLEAELVRLAREGPSGLVRSVLASTLQRLPVSDRLPLARALTGREEDATDPNIPGLIWTALVPVAETAPEALAAAAADCRSPVVLRSITRRLGEEIETRPGPLNALLKIAERQPATFQSSVVAGLSEALTGWRKAARPAAWEAFAARAASLPDPILRDRLRDLNVVFGDGRALEEVRRLALDETADLDARKAALRALIENRPPDLRSICERLARVRFLNAVAVRGLALFDDPAIGRTLARNYRSFHPSERGAVLDTLVSRPAFARALLDQIAEGRVPRGDLDAFRARQIKGLGAPELARRLSEVWGEVGDAPSDLQAKIEALKQRLGPDVIASADGGRGRAVFNKSCASCHRLHGHGGTIGPDLTGGGRENLDYLLENLLAPSSTVSADFRMSVVAMKDGRVLNGLVRAPTERTLTLQTQTEALVLERAEIDEVRPSALSLMPDGLLDSLSATEVRDLIGYLMRRTQVPLPPQGP